MSWTLLYDSFHQDPVAEIVLTERGRRLPPTRIFSLQNLDVNAPSSGLLINRLFRLSRDNFKEFAATNHTYTHFKFSSAHLAHWIRRFSQRTSGPGIGCLGGHYYPLNSQWYQVSQTVHEVAVPKFAYGFGYEDLPQEFNDPIVHDPNDLSAVLNPPNACSNEKIWHPLIYERLQGRPLVAYFFGDHLIVKDLETGRTCQGLELQTLGRLTWKIARALRVNSGEIIFFETNEKYLFASFSHSFENSRKYDDFHDLIITSLNDWNSSVHESEKN